MNKLLLILTFFWCSISIGQYANDWIDYSQKYYSFKISQDGVYQIDHAAMTAAGIPVTTISPDNFQLFAFQSEQQILVEDGGDGSFDAGDYILFYGRKNTTWLDSLMYDSPEHVANKFYPHYNDTINYFLTWNSSVTNARIQEETDVSFGSYGVTPYFFKRNHIENHQIYSSGLRISGMSYSRYTDGEGWSGTAINGMSATSYQDVFLPTSNAFTGAGAPSAEFEARSIGYSNATVVAQGNHHLRVQYSGAHITVVDTIYTGYRLNKLPFSIDATSLSPTTTKIRHQIVNDQGLASDYQSVTSVEVRYAHNPNLGNTSFFACEIEHNTISAKSRFDLSNFISTAPMAMVISGNQKLLPVIDNAGTHQVLVPNASNSLDQEVVFFDAGIIQNIAGLNPVNGNGNFTDYSSISFEDVYIVVSGQDLMNSAVNYANYRESVPGGSYTTLVADEHELGLQFGGGVPKHPFGVRRFIEFAYGTSTVKPNNLFIIGKGIREANENVAAQFGTRQSPISYEDCIVPALGFPCSDILLTSALSGSIMTPLIPTGRLAAKNVQEVNIYLNKMIEYEFNQDPNSMYNVQDKLWQKEILHFGGGSTAIEQNQFKNYLQAYEDQLEGGLFGGNVTSFYKTVSDPIDPVTLYEVNDYINNGVSLMTFFGHASADGFDQNVDEPSNWDNKGKYPVVVGNACLTGNIFEPTATSTSEKYVLLEDKGSIAFLANVKQAFSNSLNDYSYRLFSQIANDNYGGTLGSSIYNTIDLLDNIVISFGNENVMSQMTLHGDPAIRNNPHEKPELEINQGGVFITPEVVDLTVDSIDVNVVVYNLGMATSDTFAIELTRHFPNNGPDSLYTKLVGGIGYIDTVVFTIPFYNNLAIGINEFEVVVDQPSVIVEQYDEIGNNQLTFQEIFDVDGIYPVWPYEFAVVPGDTLTLKGSTVNPFADFRTYRFEVDTTDLFNSPEHRYSTKFSAGGVVETEYNQWINMSSGLADELILEDSMVYFWRVAVEDTGSYYWIESSFQHIDNKVGWGQDHFFQFKNNDFLFLNYLRPTRQRTFGPAFRTIDCDVFGNATSWLETAYTLYHIDGEIEEYNFCGIQPKLLVSVIDPVTLEPWGTYYDDGVTIQNPNNDFGNINNNGGCRPRVEYHFAFQQDIPASMDAFDNMILNEVPDGHYILIYTARYAEYANWDADNFATFASLGCDSIHPGQTENKPFIVYTQKGNTGGSAITVQNGGTKEVYGDTIESDISMLDTLWGFDFYGAESTPLIGPAINWHAAYWNLDSLESPTDDSTRIQIWGYTHAGAAAILIDTLTQGMDSIEVLGAFIDANIYPYVQIHAQQWDKTGFTPSQIDSWHVLYDDVPEAALSSAKTELYWNPGDTLYEGQDLAIAFDIENISDLHMDSLLVNYWIEDAQHGITPIAYPRQDSLRVAGTIRDTIHVNSEDFDGLNSLWVEVNPYVSNGVTDQIEKYHFNNIGQKTFTVSSDNQNPILDVTFNGYHILNGDIVDPTAEVVISLKDDNPYLIMDSEADTANFGLYLTHPDGFQQRLNFRNSLGEPLLEWIPADASNRKFKIIMQADFEQDGEYRLLVQGIDKSDNLSGDFEYDIEFEVDHNSSITNLMNFPNPFTTSTRFVFTLTGSEVPDEFTIQIMNVSGTVVREITRHELGDIQIGRNITDFEWDGTDEYGDKLARGVYLYRVIVKMNGESIEHRESGADKYFKKSFGKMYLL